MAKEMAKETERGMGEVGAVVLLDGTHPHRGRGVQATATPDVYVVREGGVVVHAEHGALVIDGGLHVRRSVQVEVNPITKALQRVTD